MYSYNRIHNNYDTNVVRVELNSSSSYRPHTTSVIRTTSREPLKSTAIVNRSDTFTKNERPSLSRNSNNNNSNNNNSGIIRSETFIVKQHQSEDNSSDERNKYQQKHQRKVSYSDEHEKVNYGTYTRSSKKNSLASEGKDDKSNYSTYTRNSKREKEKRGNGGCIKD